MDVLVHDLRYAIRSLRRTPAFTIAAVLTLAIGIGANTAIFSVVNRVLLRPSSFREINRLALVWETDRNAGTTHEPSSIPDYVDFRVRSRAFDGFAAVSPAEANATVQGSDPERLTGLAITANWFSMVGQSLLIGRAFTEDEARQGGARVAIISEDLWKRRFNRSTAAVGSMIRLDEVDWQIVGIAPSGADFGTLQLLGSADYARGFADRGGRPQVDIWTPLRISSQASRDNHPIFVVGHLAHDATLSMAQQDMARITGDLEREYRSANDGRGAFVESFSDVVFRNVRVTMWMLVATVGLVLLVACVNVANLLLARAAARAREVTLRTALGASVGRLARQFVAESLVIVAAGAGFGTLLAVAIVDVMRAVAPATVPRANDLRLDGSALLASGTIAVVIAFVFGLLPTLYARRVNLATALQSDSRSAAGGRRQRRLRSALVVSELAMATMLTVGATLLIKSLWTLENVDPGFDAAHVLKAEFQLPSSRYPQDARWPKLPERQRFMTEVVTRLSALPGVERVALATSNPMDAGFTSSISVVNREAEAKNWPEPSIRTVSDGYFATMRVPLRAGRTFESSDDAGAPPVLLINESARARFFEGHEAVGAQISLWGSVRTVVGVVGNERIKGLAADAPPAVYMPLAQAPAPSAILVRTKGDATLAAPLIRRVVHEVDPQLALFGVEPLTETIQGTLAQRRFAMLVLMTFAVAALVLAAVGVHGVLSYTITQRTREIGIRVALGADMRRVWRLVLGQGATLAAYGVGIGVLGALVLSRFMKSLLFEVSSFDPATFVTVAAVLAGIAMTACWFPARRAARVEPIDALRQD